MCSKHGHSVANGSHRVGFAALVVAACLLSGTLWPAAVTAQITLDGSMGGGARPLTGPNYTIDSVVGQTRGGNLFHSFGQFNILTGESATFTNSQATAISNIFSRVTGGNQSVIDGLLRSTIPGAHFYLINPSGVMFGPNASLQVGGAFHVSTANYVRFADGAKFHADLAQNSVLTTAAPIAFGFLGPSNGTISVNGSSLQVDPGQTLSLVGGNVEINGGSLSAPSGRIQIASTASAGEVSLVTAGGQPQLDVSSFARLGEIRIAAATLDVGGAPNGSVVIRGGRVTIDQSLISADNFADVDGERVAIDANATGDLVVGNASFLSAQALGAGRGGDIVLGGDTVRIDGAGTGVLTLAAGAGRGGDIVINAGDFSLTGGAGIASFTTSFDSAAGGDINLTASRSALISGRDLVNNPTIIFTETDLTGPGGHITVNTPSLNLLDGGTIRSSTFGDPAGPPITAPGGPITINGGDLALSGGGQISSHAGGFAPGGSITVNLSGTLTAAGTDTGILSGSFGAPGAGQAGDISVAARNISLADHAAIQSGSAIEPQGGNVTVSATNAVSLSGGAGIASQAGAADVGQVQVGASSLTLDNGFVSTSTTGAGRAGTLAVNAGTLSLVNGGQITSSSELQSTNDGGAMNINAGSVSISGRGPGSTGASPFSGDPASGLFSTTHNTGNGGAITVSASSLSMADGGKISVQSLGTVPGSGNAGSIALNVGSANMTGTAVIESGTQGPGAGGNVQLSATDINMSGGATISARSIGTGNAGDITIRAQDTFAMHNNSAVTTQAVISDGGNIVVQAGQLVQLDDSRITTSVESGFGSGGNITIDPQFVLLNGSQIRADAFGGPGGNIKIIADTFLTTGSIISASSALSTPGTISIQASITDVTAEVTQLPTNALQAANLLRASCAARFAAGRTSTLVLAGRDAIPTDPAGPLPSPLLERIGDFRLAAEDETPVGFRLASATVGHGRLCR